MLFVPNDSFLDEACPARRLPGKESASTWNGNTKKIFEQARKARTLRQGQQADSTLCTWIYALIDLSTNTEIKRSEMDERDAAIKNRSIKPLGLLWRRAPY